MVAILTAMGALVFLMLELTARVYLFGFAGLVPDRINSVHGLAQTGLLRLSSEPRLEFELRPNVDGYHQLARFRTNSQGLRDKEYPFEKPDGTFRVAILGSSFSLPTGVPIEAAFHSLLEERLTEESATHRYEFINFSVGMYNAEKILAMFELRALDYDPDLAIVTITKLQERWIQIDSEARRGKAGPKPSREALHVERTYPALQSFFVRLVKTRTGWGSKGPLFPVGFVESLFVGFMAKIQPDAENNDERFTLPIPDQTTGLSSPEASRKDGSVLDRLALLQRRTGIPIVLVRLEMDSVKKSHSERRLEQAARVRGLHYFDTRHAFKGMDVRKLWIHPLDPHPNPHGHAIFAREILAFLRQRDLLAHTGAADSSPN